MRPLLLLVLLTASAFVAGCGDSKADPPPAATGSHDKSGPITEARLGLKIYPGATIVTSGETGEIVSANLRTSDPAAKVVAFYETELGAKASSDPAGSQISGEKGGKEVCHRDQQRRQYQCLDHGPETYLSIDPQFRYSIRHSGAMRKAHARISAQSTGKSRRSRGRGFLHWLLIYS